MRPLPSSSSRAPRETQPVLLRHPDSPFTTPCVLLYQGPHIASDDKNTLRNWFLASGLPSLTLSHDKVRDRIQDAFGSATRHLDAGPHIFLEMHGDMRSRHGVLAGGLLGEPKDQGVYTADLLASIACGLRRPGRPLPVIHVLSCMAGGVADELVPGSERWRAGHVILYAGQQAMTPMQIRSSLNTALRYLALCRQRALGVDPLRLFLLAGLRRGDCMTLLGGELKAPLRWHGPKSGGDLSDTRRQAELMDGHPDDIERLARLASTIRPDEEALLPDLAQAEVDIFFSRLIREDHPRLCRMLQQRPELVNTPDCEQTPPLMTAIDDGNIETIDLLVVRGADLEMRDADGDTPLLYLTKTHFESEDQAIGLRIAARLLALGANPHQRDSSGDSVLTCAVKAGWLDLIGLLLAHGADPGNGKDEHSPLAIARRAKRPDIARLLKSANRHV